MSFVLRGSEKVSLRGSVIHPDRYKLAGHDHDDNDDDNLLSREEAGRDTSSDVGRSSDGIIFACLNFLDRMKEEGRNNN